MHACREHFSPFSSAFSIVCRVTVPRSKVRDAERAAFRQHWRKQFPLDLSGQKSPAENFSGVRIRGLSIPITKNQFWYPSMEILSLGSLPGELNVYFLHERIPILNLELPQLKRGILKQRGRIACTVIPSLPTINPSFSSLKSEV